MERYFSGKRVFTILALLYSTFCYGQVQKDLAREKVAEVKTTAAGQTKLRKSQGSQAAENVHGSLQDKAGNLWFATTHDGVFQYDGKLFRQFTTKSGLNSNRVWCIFEDRIGKIWIGTDAGICLYDGKTFSGIQIPLPNHMLPNKYHKTHDVWSIMQDRSGKLWFATIDGVYSYNGKSFTPFAVNAGMGGFMSSNSNVEYILEDKAGNLWFGGRVNKGVFLYDGKSIIQLRPDGDHWAWPVLQDKNGNIWFSNWAGAYRYDGKTFKHFTKDNGLPGDIVTRIMEDSKGNIWFGGASGICRYDGKSFTRFTTKEGLVNNDIWSMLEDRAGNIWVGTRNIGLYRYDGEKFVSFSE